MKEMFFVIDDCCSSKCEIFGSEKGYETEQEAIKEADSQWDYLTDRDKKERDAFYVGLYPVDEDKYADLEHGCKMIKEYK